MHFADQGFRVCVGTYHGASVQIVVRTLDLRIVQGVDSIRRCLTLSSLVKENDEVVRRTPLHVHVFLTPVNLQLRQSRERPRERLCQNCDSRCGEHSWSSGPARADARWVGMRLGKVNRHLLGKGARARVARVRGDTQRALTRRKGKSTDTKSVAARHTHSCNTLTAHT